MERALWGLEVFSLGLESILDFQAVFYRFSCLNLIVWSLPTKHEVKKGIATKHVVILIFFVHFDDLG